MNVNPASFPAEAVVTYSAPGVLTLPKKQVGFSLIGVDPIKTGKLYFVLDDQAGEFDNSSNCQVTPLTGIAPDTVAFTCTWNIVAALTTPIDSLGKKVLVVDCYSVTLAGPVVARAECGVSVFVSQLAPGNLVLECPPECGR